MQHAEKTRRRKAAAQERTESFPVPAPRSVLCAGFGKEKKRAGSIFPERVFEKKTRMCYNVQEWTEETKTVGLI